MREPFGPRERDGTPEGDEPSTTPGRYQPQRSIDQFIGTTLHEIQHDQGRHTERLDALLQATTALTQSVTTLTERMSHVDRTLQEIEPKVAPLHENYLQAVGAFRSLKWTLTIVGAVIAAAGGLLYWTNSSRLDKLIKVLDSPGIEKLLKKDGR